MLQMRKLRSGLQIQLDVMLIPGPLALNATVRDIHLALKYSKSAVSADALSASHPPPERLPNPAFPDPSCVIYIHSQLVCLKSLLKIKTHSPKSL